MQRGTILLHTKFEFRNGETSTKFLIVLNTPSPSQPYLVVRTTSNTKRKPDKAGCHPQKGLFAINADYDFFPKKTWVQIYDIFEFSTKEFLRAHFQGYLKKMGQLRDQTINEIVNCTRRSPDTSKYHLGLLGKRGK